MQMGLENEIVILKKKKPGLLLLPASTNILNTFHLTGEMF